MRDARVTFPPHLLQDCYTGSSKREQVARGTLGDCAAAIGEEPVSDDFGLLLEPVPIEGFSGSELILITAERMSHQGQVEAALALGLPDVRHFVNEEALAAERLFREIIGPDVALGVEIDVSHRRHGRVARMEWPPFSLDEPNARIIDRAAENRTSECDFSGREGASFFHRHRERSEAIQNGE